MNSEAEAIEMLKKLAEHKIPTRPQSFYSDRDFINMFKIGVHADENLCRRVHKDLSIELKRMFLYLVTSVQELYDMSDPNVREGILSHADNVDYFIVQVKRLRYDDVEESAFRKATRWLYHGVNNPIFFFFSTAVAMPIITRAIQYATGFDTFGWVAANGLYTMVTAALTTQYSLATRADNQLASNIQLSRNASRKHSFVKIKS